MYIMYIIHVYCIYIYTCTYVLAIATRSSGIEQHHVDDWGYSMHQIYIQNLRVSTEDL